MQPWTVRQEFTRQSDEDNRFYTEPRCIEGNHGLLGIIRGRRTEERAFAEGPRPRSGNPRRHEGRLIFDDEPLR